MYLQDIIINCLLPFFSLFLQASFICIIFGQFVYWSLTVLERRILSNGLQENIIRDFTLYCVYTAYLSASFLDVSAWMPQLEPFILLPPFPYSPSLFFPFSANDLKPKGFLFLYFSFLSGYCMHYIWGRSLD